MAEVRRKGGDVGDKLSVLGQNEVQFGIFKGKTFQWLVDNMRAETTTTAPLSKNKHAFKNYLNSFPEGQCVVELKAKERMKKSKSVQSQSKMEALFILLCQKYPQPIKQDSKTVLRWTLIGNAYKKIRDVVISNPLVMKKTSIQLVEINQHTLTRWYAQICSIRNILKRS